MHSVQKLFLNIIFNEKLFDAQSGEEMWAISLACTFRELVPYACRDILCDSAITSHAIQLIWIAWSGNYVTGTSKA